MAKNMYDTINQALEDIIAPNLSPWQGWGEGRLRPPRFVEGPLRYIPSLH